MLRRLCPMMACIAMACVSAPTFGANYPPGHTGRYAATVRAFCTKLPESKRTPFVKDMCAHVQSGDFANWLNFEDVAATLQGWAQQHPAALNASADLKADYIEIQRIQDGLSATE